MHPNPAQLIGCAIVVAYALILTGCYETVNEKQRREETRQDTKDLQRRDR